ncbi:hypothetical protein F5148DRAFT_712578 [Russula earlei]|uniref:Uncharacterized protein n=1 Tax=Russula earlei TaxID=71964 RepID=A0ACC0TUD2_9AGAM|nr:hypothetical protein F5148DRAFT_712578 [Russula earlei]
MYIRYALSSPRLSFIASNGLCRMTITKREQPFFTNLLLSMIQEIVPGAFQEIALMLTVAFAKFQADRGKPEYVEKEIHRFRTLLSGTSHNNPARPVIIEQLAQLLDLRSNDFGVTEDLQDGRSDDSEPQNIPPFRDLSDALRRSSDGESTPIELEDQYFDALSLRLVTDIADLEDAIMYARLLLASCHPGSRNAALVSAFLGMALIKAFSWTNSIKYLNEAISFLRDVRSSPAQLGHFSDC